MTSEPEEFQERVLRSYALLRLLDPKAGWGGGLVLSVGLDPLGASVALAANIAGAVLLALDARPEMCRAALRSGACDFAVNSVDEALRVIKNEIRKHQPLSVALQMQPAEALEELLGRGVQPQLFVPANGITAVGDVSLREIPVVSFDPAEPVTGEILHGCGLLDDYLAANNLDFYSFVFASAPLLRAFDARASGLLADDLVRHRWSLAAPIHFLRERPHRRILLLHPEERVLLQEEFPGS